MNLGKILHNLLERKVTLYNLTYDPPHEITLRNLKSIPNLSDLKISPILLITDSRPHSLISIAYAFKIVLSLGSETEFHVLTEGKHSEFIKKECKVRKIALISLGEKNPMTVEVINQVVEEHQIGLIIMSYGHELWENTVSQVPTSVLVSSIKNFR